jgi:hypothetical protein
VRGRCASRNGENGAERNRYAVFRFRPAFSFRRGVASACASTAGTGAKRLRWQAVSAWRSVLCDGRTCRLPRHTTPGRTCLSGSGLQSIPCEAIHVLAVLLKQATDWRPIGQQSVLCLCSCLLIGIFMTMIRSLRHAPEGWSWQAATDSKIQEIQTPETLPSSLLTGGTLDWNRMFLLGSSSHPT